MPSGKQSKRKRAAAPPPVQAKGQRRASPRVLLAAGGVAVLVVVAIVLALTLGGGKGTPAKLSGAPEVRQLLQGIPQHGNVLGRPSAPVTLVEYIDLQCPYCQQFETQAMPTLVKRYVRTGKVKVEARLLAFIGPDSARGRDAAIAAGLQNRLFDFAELLYYNQGPENSGWLDSGMVKAAAASIPGLDVSKLLSDLHSDTAKAEAARFDRESKAAGVKSTPTILVGRTGTTLQKVQLTSAIDAPSVAAAIDAALGS